MFDEFLPRNHIPPYLPSLQPIWVKVISQPLPKGRIKHGSALYDIRQLNWFTERNHAFHYVHKRLNGVELPSAPFHYPYALYSPGHAELDLDKAAMSEPVIINRDKSKSFLLVDSGGFQVGKDSWEVGKSKADDTELIKTVLQWQEVVSNMAAILELPRWKEGVSFDEALDWTNFSLGVYTEQGSGKVPFLNILHGKSWDEIIEWYEKTKWFDSWGLCFGGRLAKDFHLLCKLIFYIYRKGELERVRHIHLLGNGTSQSAIAIYTLSEALRRRIGVDIVFTQDAASEAQDAGKYKELYLENKRPSNSAHAHYRSYHVNRQKINGDPSYTHGDAFYPHAVSPYLAPPDGIRFGDYICEGFGGYNLDGISDAITYANNIYMRLQTISHGLELERRSRRLRYNSLKASKDPEFAKVYRRITGGQPVWDGNALVPGLVDVTTAFWSLFVDEFEEDRDFNGDVKQLEKHKTPLTEVAGYWKDDGEF